MHSDQYKKLIYQLRYRGSKELDFIGGKILKHFELFLEETHLLGKLLEESEQDLHNWFIQKASPPHEYDELVLKIQRLIHL